MIKLQMGYSPLTMFKPQILEDNSLPFLDLVHYGRLYVGSWGYIHLPGSKTGDLREGMVDKVQVREVGVCWLRYNIL